MLKDITTLRDGKSRQLERNEAIAHAALTHRERRFNYLFREKKQIETNNFLTEEFAEFAEMIYIRSELARKGG
jgi:hypothetical protein